MNNTKIIFGAPGCGKTTRLMAILEQELKTHNPDKIAFVSFTRKGTYEGVKRAQEKFGFKENDLPYFRTLHSIAFRDGELSKYDMIQKRHYKDFSAAMHMNFTGYYTEEFYNNDDKYLFLVFLERNNPNAAKRFSFDMDTLVLNSVRKNYLAFKAFARVTDFTDILEEFVKRDKALPVEVAIIDEAQDLTSLQWDMCRVAFKDCQTVYVAGDDEQAIYEWSGADVEQFLKMKGEREILQQSYRLPRKILELSKRISGMILNKVEKQFNCVNEEGEISFYNSLDYLKINPNESYYFLSRNNWFLGWHRTFLKERAQVFYDKDKLSIDRREVRAIQLWEKSRKNDLTETERVQLRMFLPEYADKKKPWYDVLVMEQDRMSYYKDLIKAKTDLTNVRHTVNTIHGVKGGEADNVVLLLDFTKSVKANFEKNPDSELRCLYVACTRAKKHLHIVHSQSKNGYDSYVPLDKE